MAGRSIPGALFDGSLWLGSDKAGGHVDRLRRRVLATVSAFGVNAIVVTTLRFDGAGTGWPWTRPSAPAIGAAVAGCIAGIVLMWWGWRIASLICLGAALAVTSVFATDDLAVMTVLLLALSVAAVQFGPHSSLLAISGFTVGLVVSRMSTVSTAAAIDSTILQFAVALVVRAVVLQLVIQAREADRVDDQNLAAEMEASLSRAELAASSSIREALHDQVLPALAWAGRGDGAVVPKQAFQDAAAALDSAVSLDLATPEAPQSVPDILRRVRERSPLTLSLDVAHDVSGLRIDGPAADALERAMLEGVRNAGRHGGADRVHASVGADGSMLRITLVDSGIGGPIEPGWGITNSILNPLSAVGGSCDLHGTPGSGTSLILRAPVRPPSREGTLVRTHRETLEGFGDLSAIMVALVAAMAAHSWIALRHIANDANIWPGLVLWALVGTATVLLLLRVRRHPPSLALLAIWSVAAAAAIWLGVRAAEPDALMDYNSWVIGYVAVSASLISVLTPVRVGIWATLVMLATTFAAAHVSMIAWWQPIGAYVAAFPALASLAIGYVLRQRVREIAERRAQLRALSERVQLRRARTAVAAGQEAMVRERVIPALERLADKQTLESTDVSPALLIAEIYDELALTGLLDEPIRHRLRQARGSGTTIKLSMREGTPSHVGPVLRLIDRLVDHSTDITSLSVLMPTHEEPHALVLVMPRLSASQLDEIKRPLDGSAQLDITESAFGQQIRVAF